MHEINDAVADTPNIVNPEHLLVAAMPFGPIIDMVNFHEQPFKTLIDKNYNTDINVIVGAAQECFMNILNGVVVACCYLSPSAE